MKNWEVNRSSREHPVHVIPCNDAIEHLESAGCWCQPTVDEDGRFYVHHSADGRELHEPGAQKPATRH